MIPGITTTSINVEVSSKSQYLKVKKQNNWAHYLSALKENIDVPRKSYTSTIMRKKSQKKEKSRKTDQAVRRMKNLKGELRRPENGPTK